MRSLAAQLINIHQPGKMELVPWRSGPAGELPAAVTCLLTTYDALPVIDRRHLTLRNGHPVTVIIHPETFKAHPVVVNSRPETFNAPPVTEIGHLDRFRELPVSVNGYRWINVANLFWGS